MRYSFHWVHSGVDKVVASFEHHFDPHPRGFSYAVAYDEVKQVSAVPAVAGDKLVWRFEILGSIPDGGTNTSYFVPNGDGPLTHGRYPSITIPAESP